MDSHPKPDARRAPEVFVAFLRQGLTAFGGPIAHLGYFRRDFVQRRGWLDEAAYADLVTLAHFLPGPSSSQVGMAIGLRRAGLAGALAAWLGFTLPAGLAMIALAYLAPQLSRSWGEGWLHGLKIAAAAIVLQAVIGMWRSLVKGPVHAGMAIGAAAGLLIAHGPAAQAAAIIAGAVIGRVVLKEEVAPASPSPGPSRAGPPLAALGLFALLLAGLPLAAWLLQSPLLALSSVLYRSGALVFGGGHLVLPLLQAEIVDRGWMPQDVFLAGYGAAQALPGPLFAFAGFVGAAQSYAPSGWLGGLVGLAAIFLPGSLLILAAAPFWEQLKSSAAARGAVAGAGAVVVGVLAAALWSPVLSTAVLRPSDWALVAAAFVFLAVAKLPPWLVVIGFAATTGLLLR